jgi:hypothetical protein
LEESDYSQRPRKSIGERVLRGRERAETIGNVPSPMRTGVKRMGTSRDYRERAEIGENGCEPSGTRLGRRERIWT